MKTSLALLGISAIIFCSSEAAAWTGLDNGYPRWANMPVTYRINEGTIPQSIATFGKARLDQAIAAWAAPSCTFWNTQNLGNTTTTYNYNDGQNIFMFRSGTWPSQLGDVNSVIGVTMPVWDNNDEIYDADIVYNNVGFCWNDTGTNNCVDTLSIAVHEDGHFLGLGHSNAKGATMEPFYGGGNSIASIEQDDIDGVCALYPSQGTGVSSSSGGSGGSCDSCANASSEGACAGAFNNCAGSQPCVQFYQCITQCNNQACVNACASQFPTGASLYGAYVDCVCSVCSTECASACGGSSGSSSSSSSSSSGNGSSSGSPGTGGMGGAGGSTGAWTSDDEPPPLTPSSDGGCSCSMAPAPLRFSAFLGASALVLAFARRRSRRSGR